MLLGVPVSRALLTVSIGGLILEGGALVPPVLLPFTYRRLGGTRRRRRSQGSLETPSENKVSTVLVRAHDAYTS